MGCIFMTGGRTMNIGSQTTRNQILERMAKLEGMDYARPNDYAGIDKYDPDWMKEGRAEGFSEYQELKAMLD